MSLAEHLVGNFQYSGTASIEIFTSGTVLNTKCLATNLNNPTIIQADAEVANAFRQAYFSWRWVAQSLISLYLSR
jgi:hypothetical protein